MTGIEYVFVAQFFTVLMLGVVFLLAWRTIEPRPHTRSWSLLFFLATGQFALNALVDQVPLVGLERDIYWVAVNAMALGVQALAWVGFRQRAGRRGWPPYLVIYLAAVEALVVWFTLVSFHQGMRMVLIPWSGTVLQSACAWTLATPGRKLRATEWGAASTFLVNAVIQLVSGAAALAQGALPDDHWLGVYQRINFLAMPAAFTGLGLFTVLIIADDLANRMRTLAITDQLTGVLNRRGFGQAAARILALARRRSQSACVALADLDHFKAVNDAHGHEAGDQALGQLARILSGGIRGHDLVGRIGGEEFALLLPWTDLPVCLEVVERLRKRVESTPVEAGKTRLFITASFGVASVSPEHETVNDALRQADKALYEAKRAGRNRVVCLGTGNHHPID